MSLFLVVLWSHITWMLFAPHTAYSEFYKDDLIMVNWPKHAVIVTTYIVVFGWNLKLFSFSLITQRNLTCKNFPGFCFCFMVISFSSHNRHKNFYVRCIESRFHDVPLKSNIHSRTETILPPLSDTVYHKSQLNLLVLLCVRLDMTRIEVCKK